MDRKAELLSNIYVMQRKMVNKYLQKPSLSHWEIQSMSQELDEIICLYYQQKKKETEENQRT